jgi:hypothetical protein
MNLTPFFLLPLLCGINTVSEAQACRLTNRYVLKAALEHVQASLDKYPDQAPEEGYEMIITKRAKDYWYVSLDRLPAMPESRVLLKITCGNPKVEAISFVAPPPP